MVSRHLLLLLAPLLAHPQLRIGIIGDQSYTENLTKSYEVLGEAAQLLSKARVAAVLHTGDLLESSASPEKIREHFGHATKLLDAVGVPWHLTPGDHDVNPPLYKPNSEDTSRKELFYEMYRARESKLQPGLWHSFDLEGYHFISLNSQENFHVDPRWGDVFLARVSAAQKEWLKRDLDAHRKAKGIVIFLHQPLWYNWAGWVNVHRLIRDYKVVAVIAGHFHYDQDEGTLDGIRYVVVGATGGRIKRGARDSGNAHHVTLLTLDKRGADFRLIPLDGAADLPLTPRADMDRVQALDIVLGELHRFPSMNALCTDGKTIAPPKLSLVPVANPIDVPVTVEVSLTGDQFELRSPTFISDSCPNRAACVLPPAARVESSNTSSVILNDRYSPLPPIWESEVALGAGRTAALGDAITLKVRLSFDGVSGPHWAEGSATTKLTACASK